MTIDAARAQARAYFEQVLNRGDMAVADRIFDPALRFHYPLGELDSAAAVKDYLAVFRSAFPDAHFALAELFGADGSIAARWELTATQTGVFKGRAASNRAVRLPGITVFHVAGGRIREIWVSFDPVRLTGA